MLNTTQLAYAFGNPTHTGEFKKNPADFKVDEQLGFELTGHGEHVFLRIEKQGLNTEELIKQLARAVNKPVKHISCAGLKDKQAVTTQWISIHCPGEELPESASLKGNGWHVLESTRHLKKLKTGALSCNRFQIIIRDIEPCETLDVRMQHIKAIGVPNYFGPQRFGHQGQNLAKAEAMLLNGYRVKDRFLRGMYYSTARSFLFNCILSARVEADNWNKALSGDVMQLTGSHSIFSIEEPDDVIIHRVNHHDISPASVLYGKGPELVGLEANRFQQNILEKFRPWCDALESHGLEKSYRAHILQIPSLTWQWQENALALSFELPPGAYATSVLREMMMLEY